MSKRSPMDDGRPGFGTLKGWVTAIALGGLLFLVGQTAQCAADSKHPQPKPVKSSSR